MAAVWTIASRALVRCVVAEALPTAEYWAAGGNVCAIVIGVPVLGLDLAGAEVFAGELDRGAAVHATGVGTLDFSGGEGLLDFKGGGHIF